MKFRMLSLLSTSCWIATAGISQAEILTDLTAQQKELFRHAYEERVTQDSYVSGHEVDLASLQDLVVAEPKKGKGTKSKKELPSTLQHAKGLYEDLEAEFGEGYEKATFHEKVSLLEGEEVAALTFQFHTTLPSEIRGLKNQETHLWIYPKLSSQPSSAFFLYCTGKEEHFMAKSHVQIRKGLSCRVFSSVKEFQQEKDVEKVGVLEKIFTKPYPEEKKLKQLTADHMEALRVQYETAFDASLAPFSATLEHPTLILAQDRYEALLAEDKRYTSRSLQKWVDYAGVSDHLVKSEVISHRVTKSSHLKEHPDVYLTQWIFPVSHNPEEHYLVCTRHTSYSGDKPTACSIFTRNQDRSFPAEFQ